MDIPCRRGNTLSVRFDCEDADGEAFDLTGSTMVFRAQVGDNSSYLTLVSGSDAEITVPTPSNGEVLLTLSPTQTRMFTAGLTNRYELERRISGAETTLFSGFMNVTEGINSDA